MKYGNIIGFIAKRVVIAVAAVIVGALIRKLFLGSLEEKLVWLTFYPVVMVAGLFGGFFSGLLTSLLTCIIAVFFWQFFSPKPFIYNNSDMIGMYVFIFNTLLMSGIAEYSIWQRKKSVQAKLLAEKSKEQAELANQAKSIFLANMSHELRTPLNAILGFTSLMMSNKAIPENEHKDLEIIYRSGQFLLNLINNVLDLSKIESGKITVTLTSINLKSTLNEVITMMSQRAEANGIIFETVLSENLPHFILSDELKLKQILINLLGNAIKFTEEGFIRLTVSNITGAENSMTIEIKDSGIGISEKDIKSIFDPFVQVGNAKSFKGTGLGLTICKQFTELLGGNISVDSTPGVGSTFTVTLPITFANKEETPIDDFKLVQSLSSDQQLLKILIVEDQIENWLLLQRILENIGFKTQVAENGLDGVKAFESFSPDLIFMDVRMAVLDGIEATKRIRQLRTGKEIKIIGVSAHVFNDEIQTVLESGMDDFIKKPYNFNEIYQILQKHLNVKFESVSENSNNNRKKELLTKDYLARLDKQVLTKLKKSIETLDIEELLKVSESIKESNPEVGEMLHSSISQFQITSIYRILNHLKI